MRSITGSPVENDDFFDRPRDLARLQRELASDANLLLTAPRRVGKTSLVLRLSRNPEWEPMRWRKKLDQMVVRESRGALNSALSG